MADRAAEVKNDLNIEEALTELKKLRNLARPGFSGNIEILERIRRYEETGALMAEEAQKAVVKGHDLELLTLLDPTTELYNRRAIVSELKAELKRAGRYKYPIALCMMVVDGFDAIVQSYTASTGNAVLRVAAKVITTGIREFDAVGIYTSDRFLIVMPRTTAAGSSLIAEELRERIGHQVFAYNWQSFSVTASFGISCFPENGKAYDELIALAFEATDNATARGGDRVLAV